MFLLCLDWAFTNQMIRKVHGRVYGQHIGGHMLACVRLWD